jgi:IclR family transcriptional regulator, KDG regulon repressor
MRTVPALSRGLQILELVAGCPTSLKISDVTSQLELPRSAVYELVHTLLQHEMLEQRPDGRLSLGVGTLALGSAYVSSVDLVREAQEVAHEVMIESHETAQVGCLESNQVLYLAKADSQQVVRLVSAVGRRVPAQCTALGKMMLALLDPGERRARLGDGPLVALTERSIIDPDALEAELEVTARRGWSQELGESNPEVGCVAAPVWDGTGRNIAAMSISVPAARFSPERQEELRDIVCAAAGRLSLRLGHTQSRDDSGLVRA